jgi:hypothetical protein
MDNCLSNCWIINNSLDWLTKSRRINREKINMKKKLKNTITRLGSAFMDHIGFMFKLVFWVIILFFALPFLVKLFTSFFKINIQLNDFILLITAAFIIAYAYETQKMKEQIKRQADLVQMPIIMLFIRNIQDYMKDITDYNEQQEHKRKYENFFIRIRTEGVNSNYYLSLRNVGTGAAFNIEVLSDIFEVSKYQSRFLAPLKDEQPFAIVEKGNKKIESWDRFKDCVLKISCKDIGGNSHFFQYKISDIETRKVDFIEHK